jgi:outer membrane receptor protein involved in Fe transport
MRSTRFTRSISALAAAAIVWCACVEARAFAAGHAQTRVEGVVRDQSGDAVEGAIVEVERGGVRVVTGSDGRFWIDVDGESVALRVRADGFAPAEVVWSRATGELDVRLAPAGLADEIVVTAERVETRTGDTAASVVVVDRDEIATTAALPVDAILRQVPGFSLFRRTDSRVANPTAQGATLRGLAPSGASRAAVFVDGIPLADPFGGWVYWSRVPRAGVERVEVVRGGASSLYGTDALGGVVNVIERDARDGAYVSAEASGGSLETGFGSFAAGARSGAWRVSLAGELFHTGGYAIVEEDERGPVDVEAASEHASGEARLARDLWSGASAFARVAYYAEERENGTPLQTNQTRIRDAAVGLDWATDEAGRFAFRLFGSSQGYDQSFTAVAPERASESLTRLQYVPATQIGGSAVWRDGALGPVSAVAGVDWRQTAGESRETGFFGGRQTSTSTNGGRQRTVGLFGKASVASGDRAVATVGARYDRWRNDASSPEGSDLVESAFSPNVSLVAKLTDALTLRASAYRAFRAPTLNELYRGFRVGNVVTLANDELRAERLTGAEAGLAASLAEGRLSARANFFWSRVARPVANLTLSVSPELVTRQRENLGRLRARGVEADLDWRPRDWMRVSAGYVLVDSTVTRFEPNPALEGLRVPQVPRHQGSIQAAFDVSRSTTLGLQALFVGDQFEDDLNALVLNRYATLDLTASRALGRGVALFGAVENHFGTRWEVGKTPVTTVGPPRSARVGVRYDLR